MYKEILSATAVALTFALFLPYIRSIRAGKTKPHVFSWVIWAVGTFIVFFAQLAGHAGVGAWPIGISACITVYIAALAYSKRADSSITRTDWAFLFAALSALPLWFLTSDPLWTVVVLTIVDLIGFGPTFRSAYARPHDERIGFFALGAVRNVFVILALQRYSWTTVLFPAAMTAACLALVALVAWRRGVVARLRAGQGAAG